MRNAAVWYASHGIPIFPLKTRGKEPLTPHGFKDASADPTVAAEWWRRWPNANIGIPTGGVSRLLVVDSDPRHGGPADRGEFIERFGLIPETAEAITGGDGRHFYFRDEGGPVPKQLASGVDLKGDGGYVVVPPSIHPSGNCYQWDGIAGAEALLRPADTPEWLRKRIVAARNGVRPATTPDGETWAEGQRNNKLASVAGTMRRRGMSCEAIAAALLEENRLRCDPPLPEAEVRGIAESVARYEPGAPAQTPHEWPDPLPLIDVQVDRIRPNLIPGEIGDYIQALAAWSETPVELPLLSVVGVQSCALGGKLSVTPEPGYAEPCHLYICVALESGNRKSSVVSAVTAPLVAWEKQQAEIQGPRIARLVSERRTRLAVIERVRKALKRADDAEINRIAEMETVVPIVPNLPCLFTSDITSEKLEVMLAEQGGRAALISDEGGAFEVMAGRYNEKLNLDVFLKAHAGTPVRVHRVSREPAIVDDPALTILLSPQPGCLSELRDKTPLRHRGLLARFLYALPPSPVGNRRLDPVPIQDYVRTAYSNAIHQLLEWRPAEKVKLSLSRDAYSQWKDFQRWVESQMADGERLSRLRDWGSKLPGEALRVAGLLHAANQHDLSVLSAEISSQEIEVALELCATLVSHAIATFGLICEDPATTNAKRLMRWLLLQGEGRIPKRDCFRAHQPHVFERVDQMDGPLSILEKHHLVRVVKEETGGRQREIIEINPATLKRK